MKLIKTISTTVLLLMAILSLHAQEPLKVAKGARYPFKVDVVNKVASGNYYFYWSLNWNNAGVVEERWSDDGIDKNEVVVDFADKNILTLGSNKFELQVSTKRENMCISNVSVLDIEIIDKPILEFEETEYGMYCSPSESTTKDQIDFKVNLTGYWGDWKVHYVIYEETREGKKEISDAWFTVTDNNFGEFSIILDDDRFRNTDKWDKTYHVRLEEFEYMPNPETNGVADPDLKDSLGDLFETQIAKFTVKPLVVIGKRKISFKEIKNNN